MFLKGLRLFREISTKLLKCCQKWEAVTQIQYNTPKANTKTELQKAKKEE